MNIINKKILNIFIFFILSTVLLTGCTASSLGASDDELTVSFINVGQADSILVQSPDGKNMLIDAGETINGSVKGYLNENNIKTLDVVVATHPHMDHISEMADVINSYDIGSFYMPNAAATTKTYENMLDALSAKSIKPTAAKAGESFKLGESVNCDIIAPCSDKYSDLNNYSIVIKLTYGDNSFLFTGDAETLSENEILESNVNLKADVLKVGHHGSSTSTSKAFLEAVNPAYAVISCGEGNDYGHPHAETVAALSGITTFITKDNGNIVIKSNSHDITTESKSSTNTNIAETQGVQNTDGYIGNINSKIYHVPNCSSLPSDKNRVSFSSKEEAENGGYKPHTYCVK